MCQSRPFVYPDSVLFFPFEPSAKNRKKKKKTFRSPIIIILSLLCFSLMRLRFLVAMHVFMLHLEIDVLVCMYCMFELVCICMSLLLIYITHVRLRHSPQTFQPNILTMLHARYFPCTTGRYMVPTLIDIKSMFDVFVYIESLGPLCYPLFALPVLG
jgi:hypothetical protein